MQTFSIIFRPIDNAIPAAIRLRRLLKTALRSYGLRCLDVRELPANTSKPNASGARATDEAHEGWIVAAASRRRERQEKR